MLGELIANYQGKAQENFVAGRRPNFLPCEAITGEHCSTRFARVAENGGAVSAVTELMDRCPKGKTHVPKTIVYSAGLALGVPFMATSGDPCGCDIGDELSRIGDC